MTECVSNWRNSPGRWLARTIRSVAQSGLVSKRLSRDHSHGRAPLRRRGDWGRHIGTQMAERFAFAVAYEIRGTVARYNAGLILLLLG